MKHAHASIISELFSCFTLFEKHKTTLTVTEKKARDFVTNLDTQIETLLRQWILTNFPSSKIVGEEFGADELSANDLIWFIDPIDGTTNLVEGKQAVTIHISAMQYGAPLFSAVGLPNQKKVLTAVYDKTSHAFSSYESFVKNGEIETTLLPHPRSISSQKGLRAATPIGVEFRDTSEYEHKLCQEICTKENFKPIRYHSIGYNLLQCLHGHHDCFYKPFVKLWDVLAPLTLLYASDQFDMRIYIPELSNTYSPFSNDPDYIAFVNEAHHLNGNIGLLTVWRTSMTNFSDIIGNAFRLTQQELSHEK